ncbi:MAG: hypothetical protein DMG98_18100 [Acidobacteria bacterium]|nr:MAG: hypothetical protein DMG98_18100 [Acidobacteriota bacterium]
MAPTTLDFLVAHIATLNVWYVLPVRACMPAPMLRFYPHRKAKKMRLEKYREAWHLMKPGIITALSSGAQQNHSLANDSVESRGLGFGFVWSDTPVPRLRFHRKSKSPP